MTDIPFSIAGLDPSDPQNTPKNSRANADYTPTAQEEKLIKTLTTMFYRCKKERERHDYKWIDNYKMFRGKQWSEMRPAYRHSEVLNQIFKIIQSIVPIMTDSKPKFEYLPQEPSDLELSEILNQIADWDWARNNWLYTLTEMLFDAHIYGTGLTDLDFDQKKDSGLGRIAYRSKDIFYFYPYPDAKDINDNCPYAFYAEIVDIEEIKRRYPEKGKFVKGNNEHSIVMNRSEAQFHDQKYQNPTDGYIVTGENPKNFGERKETVLFQCWWADEDFEEKQKTTKDENGELVNSYEQSKKYPNGRFIAFAENVLLVDKEIH